MTNEKEHPFDKEKLESRWNNFINDVKSNLTDKNKLYKNITDIDGNNPKQLHEIINKQVVGFSISWTVEDNYEISERTKKEINKLFDNA